MMIMSQNGWYIYNSDKMSHIFIDPKTGTDVLYKQDGGSHFPIGRYKTRHQSEIAVGLLYEAFADGKKAFRMPVESELSYAEQHRGTYSSRRNRHGGS